MCVVLVGWESAGDGGRRMGRMVKLEIVDVSWGAMLCLAFMIR